MVSKAWLQSVAVALVVMALATVLYGAFGLPQEGLFWVILVLGIAGFLVSFVLLQRLNPQAVSFGFKPSKKTR